MQGLSARGLRARYCPGAVVRVSGSGPCGCCRQGAVAGSAVARVLSLGKLCLGCEGAVARVLKTRVLFVASVLLAACGP